MAAFTKGPWTAHGPYGTGHDVHWTINRETESESGGHFAQVDAMNNTHEAFEIAEANARLIAAAPRLYWLCDSILKILNGKSEPPDFEMLHTIEVNLKRELEAVKGGAA